MYAAVLAAAGGALVVDRMLIGYDAPPPAPSSENAQASSDPGRDALRVLAALTPRLEAAEPEAAFASASAVRDVFRAQGDAWSVYLPPAGTAAPQESPAAAPPALTLTSVSLGTRPLAVFRGQEPKGLDDPLPGGWRIDAIDARSVILRQGARTHRIALVGNEGDDR